jgi:hypothetical protein
VHVLEQNHEVVSIYLLPSDVTTERSAPSSGGMDTVLSAEQSWTFLECLPRQAGGASGSRGTLPSTTMWVPGPLMDPRADRRPRFHWDELPAEDRRMIPKVLVSCIKVSMALRRGNNVFDPDHDRSSGHNSRVRRRIPGRSGPMTQGTAKGSCMERGVARPGRSGLWRRLVDHVEKQRQETGAMAIVKVAVAVFRVRGLVAVFVSRASTVNVDVMLLLVGVAEMTPEVLLRTFDRTNRPCRSPHQGEAPPTISRLDASVSSVSFSEWRF